MKFSVALCTYNGDKFLEEQLDSILNQSIKVHEIIVCDDKSSDRTIDILEKYEAQHPSLFKIYRNETNLKSVKNFEKAITLCTGDIIFLSDQDDIWVNTKVEKYVQYFDENPDINVIASNGYCIDDHSEILDKYSVWDVPQFFEQKNIKFDYFTIITHIGNIATGASMAFRKKIIPEIMPFPLIKDFHHDEWIAIIASSTNSFVLLNERYFYYRIHSDQQVGGISFNKTEEMKLSLIKKFNIVDSNRTFRKLKQHKKLLINCYKKNLNFIEFSTKYDFLFKQNIVKLKILIAENDKKMRRKNPLLFYLLSISDKILDKRQY